MVAETKDNKFDYTQLHHLTDSEVKDVEGGMIGNAQMWIGIANIVVSAGGTVFNAVSDFLKKK